MFREVTDLAYKSNAKMDIITRRLKEIKVELLLLNPDLVGDSAPLEEEVDEHSPNPILNPDVTRRRGRPRTNRYKSYLEVNERSKNDGSSGRGRGYAGRSNVDSNIV